MEIPELKKEDMKNAELPYVQQVPYFGMKKPNISENMTLQIIEMLLVLAIAVETCTATSRNHLKFILSRYA